MLERNIGREILEGLQEIKACQAGKLTLRRHTLEEPSSAKEIRSRLHLSQADFAAIMGVSLRTVQDWEQGRRRPSGPAKSLLRIAEYCPEVFLKFV
jgi:putative transcriptional regulator